MEFQFVFGKLFVFGPTFATFKQNRLEEGLLGDAYALALPEFKHCKEGDDNNDAGMFVLKHLRKMDGRGSTQHTYDFGNTFADTHASTWYECSTACFFSCLLGKQ